MAISYRLAHFLILSYIRLAPVYEYLNYHYNIAISYWAIPEELEEARFENIFRFITLPLEIQNKTKLYPYEFHEIVLHPLEIPKPKITTYGNSTRS